MNDGWLASALGDGWAWKVMAMVGSPIMIAAGFLMRRPMERAGVREVLDKSMIEQNTRLDAYIVKQDERFERERERCDEELEELRGQINALMSGPVPFYKIKGQDK